MFVGSSSAPLDLRRRSFMRCWMAIMAAGPLGDVGRDAARCMTASTDGGCRSWRCSCAIDEIVSPLGEAVDAGAEAGDARAGVPRCSTRAPAWPPPDSSTRARRRDSSTRARRARLTRRRRRRCARLSSHPVLVARCAVAPASTGEPRHPDVVSRVVVVVVVVVVVAPGLVDVDVDAVFAEVSAASTSVAGGASAPGFWLSAFAPPSSAVSCFKMSRRPARSIDLPVVGGGGGSSVGLAGTGAPRKVGCLLRLLLLRLGRLRKILPAPPFRAAPRRRKFPVLKSTQGTRDVADELQVLRQRPVDDASLIDVSDVEHFGDLKITEASDACRTYP